MRAEAAFESQCLKDLTAIGYLVHSLPDAQANRRQRGDSGFPDICFAGRGRVGFIECKMPKNKQGDVSLDDDQLLWREEIMKPIIAKPSQLVKQGFNWASTKRSFYAVATPDNWDAILEELA